MKGNIDLVTGLFKNQIEKYGDLLVNLYTKVKKGGALTTNVRERKALYRLADQYQDILVKKSVNKNKANKNLDRDKIIDILPEINFTELVNGIKKNIVVQQMTQWGGSTNYQSNIVRSTHKSSKRLSPLYQDYISYKSSQLSNTGWDFN